MPYAPLISKIRCHNPNRSKSKVCNRNYLTYIGTREGVDLTEPEFEKRIQEQLITSEVSNDINDTYMHDVSGNDIYVKYIANRPRSHGLFGNIDVNNITKLSNQLADMTSHGKNIYRGIVSLTEKDALNLGFQEKSAWTNYMRSVMPDIGNQFGIKIENLSWCAAVHMEKGHPHCHYMFWDTSERIHSSYIHTSVQNRCRELLSKEMFRAERELEIRNKTLSRDFLLEFGKKEFASLKEVLTDEYQMNLPGKIGQKLSSEIEMKFSHLVEHLPASGRISYKLISPELKKEVDDITSLILSHPDARKAVNDYYNSTKNIAATLSRGKEQTSWSQNKAKLDLEKRIGNIILAAAKETKKEFSRIDYENRQNEFKEMQKNALIKNACQSTFMRAFFSLLRANHRQSSWNIDKKFRAHSKENMIAHAKLLKNSHGYDGQEQ